MIRKYERGDVFLIDVQEQQKHEFAQAVLYFDEVGKFSLVDDNGDVLAVFGYVISDEKIGECFALLSKNIGQKIIQLIRFLKSNIPIIMNKKHIKSAIMTVKCDFSKAKKMAEILGFAAGEILPQFFCGIDYQIYERMKND